MDFKAAVGHPSLEKSTLGGSRPTEFPRRLDIGLKDPRGMLGTHRGGELKFAEWQSQEIAQRRLEVRPCDLFGVKHFRELRRDRSGVEVGGKARQPPVN